jgi:tetratricopeptide (TPR) repeat protein
MKKIAYLLIIYLLVNGLSLAQDYKGKGRVQGIVTDEQGNPVEGVKVKLFSVRASQGFDTVTDAKGIWKANWIRNGQWNVDFEKLGYGPKKISMQISEFKRNPDIEITLKKIEGLVISDELQAELIQGNELFDQGKYDEARAVYEKMLAENPDAYIIHLNIGNCYFQQENYEQAIASYQKVLEADAKNITAILGIGNCYANGGDNDKALEWYSKIEFEKIDDVTILYNIGTNYYNLSKYEEALRFYKRAVELQPDFLDGLYQLGLANLTLGNKTEAIAHFEKYLELDSDSQRAEQVRGFLEYLRR